jgi:hypothetical protein
MLDQAFLDWLRATTEARWADPSLRDAAAGGLGEAAWQPGTRWRGPISASDLEIIEAMFTVTLPAAYRHFLTTLHTPDPAMAGTQARAGRLVRVERRLFTDWTGPTTPIIAAFERPVEGLLRGVALGRWHPSWGDRPDDARERERVVRRLAADAPTLIPFAGQRYLVAVPGAGDGPVIALHGADASVIAPDLRGGLLWELGLPNPDPDPEPADGRRAAGSRVDAREIPFWSSLIGGIRWQPFEAPART